MIISLPQSPEELATHDKGEIEDLFCRLIEADRRGRHFFILSRSSAKWALKELSLSSKQVSHLTSLGESYSVRGGLPEAAENRLLICLSDQAVSKDENGTFYIGVRSFLRGSYSEASTALVLEDLVSDAKLYAHIFNEARKLTNVPSYSFEPIHAGGSRILPVFEAEVAKEKVVCCIFDTDQKTPISGRGATANGVISFHRRRNVDSNGADAPFVGHIFPSVGHELENVIPYSIAKSLVALDHNSLSFLDSSVDQSFPKAEAECFWLYFDLKNGINGESLLSKEQNGQLSTEAVDWICDKLTITRAELSKVDVSGFGSNIAKLFLDSPAALRTFHDFCRTEYWKRIFLPKFDEALWYFAAPVRERV